MSRRESVICLMCLFPTICYVTYLLGLQDLGLTLARSFGSYTNVKEQMDFLYRLGNILIGTFGVGLSAVAFGSYNQGSMSKRSLTYVLTGVVALVFVMIASLGFYYQYIAGLLGA